MNDSEAIEEAAQRVVEAVLDDDDLELRLELECKDAPDARYRIGHSNGSLVCTEEMLPAGAQQWHAIGTLNVVDVALEVTE